MFKRKINYLLCTTILVSLFCINNAEASADDPDFLPLEKPCNVCNETTSLGQIVQESVTAVLKKENIIPDLENAGGVSLQDIMEVSKEDFMMHGPMYEFLGGIMAKQVDIETQINAIMFIINERYIEAKRATLAMAKNIETLIWSNVKIQTNIGVVFNRSVKLMNPELSQADITKCLETQSAKLFEEIKESVKIAELPYTEDDIEEEATLTFEEQIKDACEKICKKTHEHCEEEGENGTIPPIPEDVE